MKTLEPDCYGAHLGTDPDDWGNPGQVIQPLFSLSFLICKVGTLTEFTSCACEN